MITEEIHPIFQDTHNEACDYDDNESALFGFYNVGYH